METMKKVPKKRLKLIDRLYQLFNNFIDRKHFGINFRD